MKHQKAIKKLEDGETKDRTVRNVSARCWFLLKILQIMDDKTMGQELEKIIMKEAKSRQIDHYA